MEYNQFDSEYYVMGIDEENSHPLLVLGQTDFGPFLKDAPIEEGELILPVPILFAETYPEYFEIPDFFMLGAVFAGSGKLKNIFEQLRVYGVQFIPVEMSSDVRKKLSGDYYAIHFWNRLRAVDKDNYSGGEPNMYGRIHDLSRFSLEEKILNPIHPRRRLAFVLEENAILLIVHENVCNALTEAGLSGISFCRIDKWESARTL
ncbi:hypothetical protein FACS1894181_18010 [Bacteroidia bacterium]|nr:hypothetical protein FACS1894181_18010 [Bacteroidia bacterium]